MTCPPKLAPKTPRRSPAVAESVRAVAVPGSCAETMKLRDGELWSADGLTGALQVRCVSGNVWLTQEGRAEDIVIGPGGMCVVPGYGKVVVQALDDAVVRIER
jgi:hypothetical protein